MGPEKQPSFASYSDFWPFYLSQHAEPRTRQLHVIGTLLGLLAFIKAILSFSLVWLMIALFLGYGFAWLSHAFVEKNRPATFEYPLWSIRGDFHMLALWLKGGLENELIKHHINS